MIFIVTQHAKLTDLIKKYWDMYESKKELSYLVKPSMPILYFGNIVKYFESPIRIITVGLNPSKRDFPDPDPFQRFLSMKQDHNHSFNQQYVAALNQYFEVDPYKAWYDASFEHLLNGVDASFYGNKENTALHTDICSPLATNPTWGALSKEAKQELQEQGVELWHELMDFLEPDIIFISVAGEHLEKIQFETVSEWETIFTLQKDRRYLINSKKVMLSSGKMTSLYFGPAAELPFGMISDDNKVAVGRQIKKLTKKLEEHSTVVPFFRKEIIAEQNNEVMYSWNEEAQLK